MKFESVNANIQNIMPFSDAEKNDNNRIQEIGTEEEDFKQSLKLQQ